MIDEPMINGFPLLGQLASYFSRNEVANAEEFGGGEDCGEQ